MPADVEFTCSASKEGKMFDFFIISERCPDIFSNPRSLPKAPWGTHAGIAIDLRHNQEDIFFNQLRVPRPFASLGTEPIFQDDDNWSRQVSKARGSIRDRGGVRGQPHPLFIENPDK